MLSELENFKNYLTKLEKSDATLKMYQSEAWQFELWLRADGGTLTKEAALRYKNKLAAAFAPSSVNTKLTAVNTYLEYLGHADCRIKTLKVQRRLFIPAEKELTHAEYVRLVQVAEKRKNTRLSLILQTICGLGLRVSELKYITVEAIVEQAALIACKGKMRVLPLPKSLCDRLWQYAKSAKIAHGPIFVSHNGSPIDRSNIWRMMQSLCHEAGVSRKKVFPHNLRHLFARTFYAKEKDVVRLADILGHSSIDTTRIYTMASGDFHRRSIERLGLLIENKKSGIEEGG